MNNAIEVLKDRIETIRIVNKEILDETRWKDFLGKEITSERKKAINNRIKALGEAIVALEKQEKIKEILAEPNVHKKNWIIAELIHDEYERLSKVVGWKTQESCQVKFDDLPNKNKEVMVGIANYIQEIEIIARDNKINSLKGWLEKEIADADKYAIEWDDANEYGLERDWNDRGNILKEVLNKLKGE